jgi:hypothetical protein
MKIVQSVAAGGGDERCPSRLQFPYEEFNTQHGFLLVFALIAQKPNYLHRSGKANQTECEI